MNNEGHLQESDTCINRPVAWSKVCVAYCVYFHPSVISLLHAGVRRGLTWAAASRFSPHASTALYQRDGEMEPDYVAEWQRLAGGEISVMDLPAGRKSCRQTGFHAVSDPGKPWVKQRKWLSGRSRFIFYSMPLLLMSFGWFSTQNSRVRYPRCPGFVTFIWWILGESLVLFMRLIKRIMSAFVLSSNVIWEVILFMKYGCTPCT